MKSSTLQEEPCFFFCVCESPNRGDHSTSPILLWPVGSHARTAAPFSPSVPRSTWCSGANALRFSHNEIWNTLTMYHHLFGQNIIEVSPRKWNTVKERDPIAPIYIYTSQTSIILCIICLSHSIIMEYQRIHYLQNVLRKKHTVAIFPPPQKKTVHSAMVFINFEASLTVAISIDLFYTETVT